MANLPGPAVTFAQELLDGWHAFGASVIRAATTPDDFWGALYSTSASITPATPAYTTTGEITGAGYVAGGVAFTFGTAPAVDGSSAIVTPSMSLIFPSVTIGPFDCVLMYNKTLAGKNAVGPFTFGAQTVVAGTFVLSMPANAAGSALIELVT